jgi:hypothetical protein
MAKQRYLVKRHRGTRTRGVVAITLAAEEVEMLDTVATARGLSRSALVGQLARVAHATLPRGKARR